MVGESDREERIEGEREREIETKEGEKRKGYREKMNLGIIKI